MPAWVEAVLNGVGTFLTSPGAGGLAALAAAVIAYRAVIRRIDVDKVLAWEERAQSRQRELEVDRAAHREEALKRWWVILQWTWENREHFEDAALLAQLDNLNTLATTVEQKTMIDGLLEAVIGGRAAP